MLTPWSIAESAHKHGVSDESIRHAVRGALCDVPIDADLLLVIGPDERGRLLEIVLLDPDDEPVVIHAMSLRPKFYDYLR